LRWAAHWQITSKDLQDIRGILWVQRGQLDLDYLQNWSAQTLEPEFQSELQRLIAEYADDKTNDS
jgi:hypothetical protein